VVRNGFSSRTQFLPKRPRQLRSGCRGTFWPSSAPRIGPWGSADIKTLDNKLWAVLEDVACRKRHINLESLRRSLVKAAAGIPLEMEHAATAEWPERLKACVQGIGLPF
jgi:hypothetical protein